MEIETTEITMSVERLSRDLRVASKTLSDDEARFLVDAYYQMQGNRIRSNNQIRQMEEEPHEVLGWLSTQADILEKSVRASLDVYSDAHPIGQRIRTVVGVGPVIAAGLIAHIDIKRAKTAGAIWKFAGLDPSAEWKKGKKRPHNAALKTLCWKLGESFVKVSNHEKDFYGKIYKDRKEIETQKNERLEFASQAQAALKEKTYKKSTDAYKAYVQDKLPLARIHARSKRWAVKIFLSHLHEVWYEHEFGMSPPAPYVMVHGGHAHKIKAPF